MYLGRYTLFEKKITHIIQITFSVSTYFIFIFQLGTIYIIYF